MTLSTGSRDLLARILLVLAALGAFGSVWSAAEAVSKADDALRVTAVHDLTGFPVYAALFLLLAWRPRGLPGVWEVLIAQKLIVGLLLLAAFRDADGAVLTGTVDVALAGVLLVAYWAARGWKAWPGR